MIVRISETSENITLELINIGFIGDYSETLPDNKSLNALNSLLKQAHILEKLDDYSILGQCQLMNTTSPGAKLYEHIKNWERWREYY